MSDIDIYYSPSISRFIPRIPDYLTLLDKDEVAIANRFKFAELRQRYIICHGILRQLLAGYAHEPPANLRIEKAEFGKPFLTDHSELCFNMSHSGDILAIAISSECQLGIDVEYYKERNTWDGLVKKCFAPEEATFWHSLDNEARGYAFYQFWVKKEAFVKAVGCGITLGLNRCVVNPDNLDTFLRVPESAGLAKQWHIRTLNFTDNQFGAVVYNTKNTLIHVREFN